jgi:hypothetical protein
MRQYRTCQNQELIGATQARQPHTGVLRLLPRGHELVIEAGFQYHVWVRSLAVDPIRACSEAGMQYEITNR